MTIILITSIIAAGISIYAARIAITARNEATTAKFVARRAIELGASAECHADEIALQTNKRIEQWRVLLGMHMENDRDWTDRISEILERLMRHTSEADLTLIRGLQETQMDVESIKAETDWANGAH